MAVLHLIENIRLAIDAHDVNLVLFINFPAAFNRLYPSYFFVVYFWWRCFCKHSTMVFADSFTGHVFAVVKADGTLSEQYSLLRGFGRDPRGRVV